jgi:WD40 repeat protein
MTTNLDTLDIQSKLSKTWKVLGKHEVTYTGGHVVYSIDHTHLICIHGEDPTAIIFYRLNTGQIVHQIDTGDDDPIATFTLSPNQQLLYTAHIRSGLIKCWNIETKQLSNSFKSEHKNDVVALELDPTGTLIASASLDQAVRIRYANNGHLTHQFFNHGSPITKISWHPNVDKLLLAVGTQNGTIRVHWLGEGTSEQSLPAKYIDLTRMDYDGTPNKSHFSRVTSLSWSPCQTKLISVGYDKVWRVWDFCYDFNLQKAIEKVKIPSNLLQNELHPEVELKCVEIASYLALDDLESVKCINYGTPVPIRKKDTNQYVTKVLEEDQTNAFYFMTSGQRGVTTIWKLSYDYIAKKKAIGMVFKHTSLQSYSTHNIPFNSTQYQPTLYAVTTGSQTHNTTVNDDNVFETPLHLQWSHMSVYLPHHLQPQQFSTKTIVLKDGRTITKAVTRRTEYSQLPLLDTDKEYQTRLIDEMKYYDSQEMLQKENKHRLDFRRKQKLENNIKMVQNGDELDDIDVADDMNDNEGAEEQIEPTPEEKEEKKQIEMLQKLKKFRGEASQNPQVMLLNGDHNLYVMNLESFDIQKTFSLYSLQINDVKIIPNSRCVVVATNSNQLRIFNIDTLNCSILFPHNDVIVSVTVSSCGRFIMSSTTRGEIFVWVLYHYDNDGFIPLPNTFQTDGQNPDKDSTQSIDLPLPFTDRRSATHISAHIVAELKGHTEAPSALAFSHGASPSFEHRLVSHNTPNNRIDNPLPSHSKFLQIPTVYNYNRLMLFACTGGSDKTVKTWNLSSLYVFVDPNLYTKWFTTSKYYKSVLITPGATKLHREQVVSSQSPDEHIFVQLSDRSIVNASYILFHNLLTSSTTTTTPLPDYEGLIEPPTRVVFTPITTTLAHEKDINSIVIHPNNNLIATCAEDKTCKIWKYNNSSTLSTSLQLLGVLKGHRRTVWSVIFTPREKFVITVSGDKLIKVWSTTDFTCVQTLQGHTAPIVQINWLRHGLQFMTGDASGIIRLWNLYDNNNGECVGVCDEPHEARINGLDIDHYRNDSFMVTGDTNAKLVFWHDTTLYDEMLAKQQEQSQQLLTQLLENALQNKNLLKAFELALRLKHPRNIYNILSDIVDNETRYKRWKALKVQRDVKKALLREHKIKSAVESGNKNYNPDNDPDIIGQDELYLNIEARENLELRVPKPKITVNSLVKIRTINELESLVSMIIDWNTNSKFSYIAQYMLNTMLTTLSPDILAQIPNFDKKIEIFLSYSQRHYTRTSNLLQSSYMIDHVLSNMNIYMPLHQHSRAEQILKQQNMLKEQALVFGSSDASAASAASAADSLMNNVNSNEALQHVLSLQVDDSLLQYEVISDDENSVQAQLAKNSGIKSEKLGKKYVNYYYGSNIKNPYESSSDDESDDYSDYDDNDGEVERQGEQIVSLFDDTTAATAATTTKQTIKTKTDDDMPAFGFDDSWGAFDDDWEAIAMKNDAEKEKERERQQHPETPAEEKKQKKQRHRGSVKGSEAKIEAKPNTVEVKTAPAAATKRKAPNKTGKQ